MINVLRNFLCVYCLILMVGCNTYVKMKPTANIDDRVRPFHGTSSVTLINGQPSKERHVILQGINGSMSGDLNQETDAAVRLTARELTKRGLQVVPNGKQVTLAVESFHSESGVKLETNVVLKAWISDGFSSTYTGTNTAYVMTAPIHHFNEALGYAVAEMLNDERFIAALTK